MVSGTVPSTGGWWIELLQPDALVLGDQTPVDHSGQHHGAERYDYWHCHVPELGQEDSYLGDDIDDQRG